MEPQTVYCVSGLKIASSIPFPELLVAGAGADASADAGAADYRFQLLPAQAPKTRNCDWFHHWELPDGERWLSLAKQKNEYLLRFEDLADFFIARDGDRITCRPQPDTPLETVRHLLLDQVVPLVLNLRGKEALHASAVLTPHGACAFIGQTGWGKSTLASSFLRCGSTPLSDDCLALKECEGHILAVPSYPGLRLWSDTAATLVDDSQILPGVAHYTEKKRLNFQAVAQLEPVPLEAIYVLTPPAEQGGEQSPEEKSPAKKLPEAELRIEPLGFSRAFEELLQCVFRLDVTDTEMLARQFLFLHRLISAVSICGLVYPRDYASLPLVREAILHDLKARQEFRDGAPVSSN
jgi:hypothetical protein